MSLAARRQAVGHLVDRYGASERRACRVLPIHRSTHRRVPGKSKQVELTGRIHELSEQYPRFGYRKIYARLKGEGWRVGRETVRLIRKREGLQVVRKAKKRRVLGVSTVAPSRAQYPNHVWSYDFVHDQTVDGRRLRCLTVVDEYTREGLAIYCARSITSGQVVGVLETLFARHGAPDCLKSDNGPELISKAVTGWLAERGVDTHFIAPGSPWENGHNESFNAVFRDGCLDRWLFYSVREARHEIQAWLREYNEERPHGALKDLTPNQFAAKTRYPLVRAA